MENITKNNTLIAQFLGLGIQHQDNEGKFPLIENPLTGEYVEPEELSYDESWDWLMPVVNMCKEKQVFGTQKQIDAIDNALCCDCTIENVYEAVVQFIKWYNENK